MNEFEQAIADEVEVAINRSMNESSRSKQSTVGISSLGFCSERLRRHMEGQVPDETEKMKAFLGTWVGEGVERALAAVRDDLMIQGELTINLTGATRTYSLLGHPDLAYLSKNLLLDTKYMSIALAKKTVADDLGKKFQRHCYGAALWANGHFGECEAHEVTVGNLIIDRDGSESKPWVFTEPLDLSVLDQAAEWLDEVVYNLIQGTEAPKEPPRQMCEKVCGFYRECRAFDTDVEGLITDPTLVAAVEMYDEGVDMARIATKMKNEAKVELIGIDGATRNHVLRWVHVNATDERAGHDKISVTKKRTNALPKGAS